MIVSSLGRSSCSPHFGATQAGIPCVICATMPPGASEGVGGTGAAGGGGTAAPAHCPAMPAIGRASASAAGCEACWGQAQMEASIQRNCKATSSFWAVGKGALAASCDVGWIRRADVFRRPPPALPAAASCSIAVWYGMLQSSATQSKASGQCRRAAEMVQGVGWAAGRAAPYVRGAPPMVASGSRSIEYLWGRGGAGVGGGAYEAGRVQRTYKACCGCPATRRLAGAAAEQAPQVRPTCATE